MSKSVPALINPTMLAWAREGGRFTIEEAAHRIGISVEKLTACEANKAQLTFAQLMKAAQTYKRPVSIFYLREPPNGWSPIQDFRLLHGIDGGFSAQLTYAIRQARERRELALELRQELNEPVKRFELHATIRRDEEALAQEIRTTLGVTPAEQQQWKRKGFENWRSLIESHDVLVFVIPRLPLSEMRGVAIFEEEFPLILINSKDRVGGKVFTLLHEFCHLIVRQSGVSGDGGERGSAPNPEVERFCNAAAAATLMPREWLLSEPLVVGKGNVKTWTDEELEALALKFAVSREAILRRLLTLGRTSKAFYETRRALFLKEYAALEETKSNGGPERHIQVLSQLGRAFTRLVFEGYHDHRLTLRDVSNYFNMQVKLIPAMEKATFGVKR